MLSMSSGRPARLQCQQGRRDFLQIGALTLGGLTLPHVLSARATAAQGPGLLKDKSVIFVFQHGGPSQFETFDPKPDAPDGIRSMFETMATSLPGVAFSEHFPKLAKLAHKLAIVRSFVSGSGIAAHDAAPIVHRETLNANLGSFYARIAGLNHPASGLPTNVLLYTRSIDAACLEKYGGAKDHGLFELTGPLGPAYAPMVPGAGADLQNNMQLNLEVGRFDDRRALLAELDKLSRRLDATGAMGAMDHFQAQAYTVLRRGAADAFDLSHEDPRTVARYDTAARFNADVIAPKLASANPTSFRAKALKMTDDHGRTLGKQLLLARRLCEAGCGFVTVNTNMVWDMHSGKTHMSVPEAMPLIGPVFDHAVATLIEDLEERGLTGKILVVCCGEFGRTPRINDAGGRDHWANVGTLLLHGGGLKTGQVIGRSTADGGEPAEQPVSIKNLIATVMHTLFDITQLRLVRGISTDVARVLTEGEPIASLV